jgi:glycosyltransferase involved in cell wall biosynthesis
MTSPLRIAVAHDWLCGYRGGEAVLEAIARVVSVHFRPAGVYTMFDDGRALAPTVDSLRHIVWPPGRLAGARRARRWLLPLYPRAVAWLSARLARDHTREPIDLLISTSSAAIKGIRPPRGPDGRAVPHLCYCHSPARYLWSQTAEYGGSDGAGVLRALGLRMLGPGLRRWDRATAANVTRFIANSTHTAGEIRRCYGREATVVFPPVRTDFFTPAAWGAAVVSPSSFWLYVGALEPYKRVDLAIRAANLASSPLHIVGGGTQRRRLGAMAGPTVTFRRRVSDDDLRELYRTARVLVFPQIEDFGIVAAEAQACGLPLAARGAGGALDIVRPGVTGVLFNDPTAESLLAAIERVPERDRCAEACRENALMFSEARFESKMLSEIRSILEPAP